MNSHLSEKTQEREEEVGTIATVVMKRSREKKRSEIQVVQSLKADKRYTLTTV